MYDFLTYMDAKLVDSTVAYYLYLGIVTDSGNFYFDSVDDDTFRVASELKKLGIDTAAISYTFYKKQTLNEYKLHTTAQANAIFRDDNSIAFITFTIALFKATDTNMAFTDGAINKLIDIDSVKVAFAVTEVSDNCYKVSCRAKNGCSACDICAAFGGGGHKAAAGCMLRGNIYDVYDKLERAALAEINK